MSGQCGAQLNQIGNGEGNGAQPRPAKDAPRDDTEAGLSSWLESQGEIEAHLLEPLRLTAYSKHFSEAGYAFISDLLDAEQEDLEELVSKCEMKKPEAKRFNKALARIKAAADEDEALARAPSNQPEHHQDP